MLTRRLRVDWQPACQTTFEPRFLEIFTGKIQGKARDRLLLDVSMANSLRCHCESKEEKQPSG